jgi:hypothetical protein
MFVIKEIADVVQLLIESRVYLGAITPRFTRQYKDNVV